jgi:hypothetical protein
MRLFTCDVRAQHLSAGVQEGYVPFALPPWSTLIGRVSHQCSLLKNSRCEVTYERQYASVASCMPQVVMCSVPWTDHHICPLLTPTSLRASLSKSPVSWLAQHQTFGVCAKPGNHLPKAAILDHSRVSNLGLRTCSVTQSRDLSLWVLLEPVSISGSPRIVAAPQPQPAQRSAEGEGCRRAHSRSEQSAFCVHSV